MADRDTHRNLEEAMENVMPERLLGNLHSYLCGSLGNDKYSSTIIRSGNPFSREGRIKLAKKIGSDSLNSVKHRLCIYYSNAGFTLEKAEVGGLIVQKGKDKFSLSVEECDRSYIVEIKKT
jgi:hypothetical protein